MRHKDFGPMNNPMAKTAVGYVVVQTGYIVVVVAAETCRVYLLSANHAS